MISLVRLVVVVVVVVVVVLVTNKNKDTFSNFNKVTKGRVNISYSMFNKI